MATNHPPHDTRSSGLNSRTTAGKGLYLNPWQVLQPFKRRQLEALWLLNSERAITRERVLCYQQEQQ